MHLSDLHAVVTDIFLPLLGFEPRSSGTTVQLFTDQAKGLTQKLDLVGMPYHSHHHIVPLIFKSPPQLFGSANTCGAMYWRQSLSTARDNQVPTWVPYVTETFSASAGV